MIALPLVLAGCGESDETQKDPVDNTPPTQSGAPAPDTAPTDRDPTPQTGTGGDSPSTAPSGTTSTPPANAPANQP